MVKTKGAKKIQWSDVRSDIQRMYVYEGLRLEDVRSRLSGQGFDASIRSYRSKINDWGFKKGSTSRTGPPRSPQSFASLSTLQIGRLPVTSSCLSEGGPGSIINGHSHSSLHSTRLDSSTLQEPHLLGSERHNQGASTVEKQPIIPKRPRLPLDLESTSTGSGNEFTFVASISTGGMLHRRTDIQASTLQMLPENDSPATHLYGLDEILLQAINHIDRGRAAELRKIFVDHSALVNEPIPSMAAFRELSRYRNLPGKTLLYWAACSSTAEVVEVLLDAGADIDKPAQTFPSQNPLFAAVARSATAIVRLLLERKASIATENATGRTALGLAVRHARDPHIVEMVLQSKTTSLQDRWSAYTAALSRRLQEYGGTNHATLTRVVRILATTVQGPETAVSAFFLAPWKTCPNWASLINEDEKKSIIHLIGHGLDLHQSFAPPDVHSDATLAHSLLFHCWEADMPKFLAQNLGDLPNRESVGGLLLRTIAAGCPCERFQGNRNAQIISVLLENGVNPESEDESGFNALLLWIRSLDHFETPAEFTNALPSLSVLLDEGGVNPNRMTLSGSYPIEYLLRKRWPLEISETIVEILVMLLSHFPDDMSTAPHWQLPRRDSFQYFPITGDFEQYEPVEANIWEFNQFTQPPLSATSSGLLLRAAHIVSMKKFLASQIDAGRDSRDYSRISLVMNKMIRFGIPLADFPTDFILDTIHLVVFLEQQES